MIAFPTQDLPVGIGLWRLRRWYGRSRRASRDYRRNPARPRIGCPRHEGRPRSRRRREPFPQHGWTCPLRRRIAHARSPGSDSSLPTRRTATGGCACQARRHHGGRAILFFIGPRRAAAVVHFAGVDVSHRTRHFKGFGSTRRRGSCNNVTGPRLTGRQANVRYQRPCLRKAPVRKRPMATGNTAKSGGMLNSGRR
jgi:hypothetical protein